MDKKSKILLWVFVVLIIGSVVVTYWRIMIKKDYIIEAQTDCDPYTQVCFVWKCDPSSTVEGEACTGTEDDIWYFQVVRKNASRIPLCDPNEDEDCEALVCGENEPECEEIFCTEDTMEEQYAVECNDPVKYTEENPVEEEAAECEEGDTECETAQEAEATTCEEGDTECETTAGEAEPAEEGAEIPVSQ